MCARRPNSERHIFPHMWHVFEVAPSSGRLLLAFRAARLLSRLSLLDFSKAEMPRVTLLRHADLLAAMVCQEEGQIPTDFSEAFRVSL